MGKIIKMSTFLENEDVERLKAGDIVYFSGELLTMRDQAHLRALELLRANRELPFDLRGRVIYHCGPIIKGKKVVSAGPTTSMRMERSEPELIRLTGLKGIIGKGGMGPKTQEALKSCTAVYLEYPGGVGALAAKAARGVVNVYWRDLGDPEAVWAIRVEEIGPCFVTMDSHGELLRKK